MRPWQPTATRRNMWALIRLSFLALDDGIATAAWFRLRAQQKHSHKQRVHGRGQPPAPAARRGRTVAGWIAVIACFRPCADPSERRLESISLKGLISLKHPSRGGIYMEGFQNFPGGGVPEFPRWRVFRISRWRGFKKRRRSRAKCPPTLSHAPPVATRRLSRSSPHRGRSASLASSK